MTIKVKGGEEGGTLFLVHQPPAT